MRTKDEKHVLIYLVWIEVETVGDYGDYVRFQIGKDISICLTCHAMSGICVRFWRVISIKSPQ